MKIYTLPGRFLSEIVTENGTQIGTMLNEAAEEMVRRWNQCEEEINSELQSDNRVRGGFTPPLPTPPGMRVRTGRFAEVTGPWPGNESSPTVL